MALINTIDELRRYVKVNASTDWNTYKPFVQDAQEKYLEPYFGKDLLDILSRTAPDALREHACRALGPFSLALATDELSINFGEAGHTVTRTTNLAPASDAKIEKATNSLLERGWHNLDRALRYLIEKADQYPTWRQADTQLQMSTALFDNYTQFQEDGLIDIGHSPLTFQRLRMLVQRVERSETLALLPPDYDYVTNTKLIGAMQAYTASRVAELQTNADHIDSLKDAPPIQLISESTGEGKNYYASQSSYWKSVITELLIKDGAMTDGREVKVNDYDRTIFFASGGRIDT